MQSHPALTNENILLTNFETILPLDCLDSSSLHVGMSDVEPKQYIWDSFRQLANLHKKDDDMITDYLESFVYMCKRVCNRLLPSEESKF